jgi:Predicted small integral membrane protein
MVVRYSKILLTAAVAFFAALVAFGNITDYGTNFAFVQHVLSMDSIFPDSSIRYRAITSSLLQHGAYAVIISTEAAVACLCGYGAWALYRHRHQSAAAFNRSKCVAVAGLTLGVLLWFVGFMAVGGEWFGMWMSQQWNGVPSAFRFVVVTALVLIYVAQRDGELA